MKTQNTLAGLPTLTIIPTASSHVLINIKSNALERFSVVALLPCALAMADGQLRISRALICL